MFVFPVSVSIIGGVLFTVEMFDCGLWHNIANIYIYVYIYMYIYT